MDKCSWHCNRRCGTTELVIGLWRHDRPHKAGQAATSCAQCQGHTALLVSTLMVGKKLRGSVRILWTVGSDLLD
jgi:hypothetical protein